MQIETDGSGGEPDFDSVFSRDDDVTDSHESEADNVASETASRSRDEQGRFTSVHNTPVDDPAQAQPQQQQPDLTQQQADSQAETPDQPQDRMIPLQELRGERHKRQEAERRLAELQGQLAAFERMQQQQRSPQPQPQARQEQIPDPYQDPEGWQRYQTQRQHIEFREQIANFSEAAARRHFGSEVVDTATQWALQNNVAQHFFLNARDPYGELVETYQRQQALTRIGNDPDSFEKRIREEERKKVLEELKAGGVNGGQPKPQFPGSLASATPTGRQGGHLDPQAAADSVFARG